MSLLYFSWLLFTYSLELYISILTTIIEISTCDFFFNNNILTQSITFLSVFSSKYVLNRIRNIFPIQKYHTIIRIFIQAFDYGNIFSKSKTNMDEDKKEFFRMKIVKKSWFLQRFNITCWNLRVCNLPQLKLWNLLLTLFCF